MFTVLEIDNDRLLTKEEFSVLVKIRAKYSCEKCGKTLEELKTIEYSKFGKNYTRIFLQAHHKDEDKKNHRLSNGICLCITCHNKEHQERKNEGLRERNRLGQASRASKAGWKKINSMPEEERKKWLKDRAAKIRESRIKNGTYGKGRVI